VKPPSTPKMCMSSHVLQFKINFSLSKRCIVKNLCSKRPYIHHTFKLRLYILSPFKLSTHPSLSERHTSLTHFHSHEGEKATKLAVYIQNTKSSMTKHAWNQEVLKTIQSARMNTLLLPEDTRAAKIKKKCKCCKSIHTFTIIFHIQLNVIQNKACTHSLTLSLLHSTFNTN
jgi:hypothetical protein